MSKPKKERLVRSFSVHWQSLISVRDKYEYINFLLDETSHSVL